VQLVDLQAARKVPKEMMWLMCMNCACIDAGVLQALCVVWNND